MSNRLAEETSPYLLQHSDNSVNWYPRGEEALNYARAEDKPILLSIGYSACHWCHVMAHECFENDDIAHLMNENFVNIKVDREERPDLDAIYMEAVQAMTGSGGWPLFILPRWMQALAKITPHGWATTGFNKLMLYGADFGAVLPEMLVLVGFAMLFGIIAIWRFRTSSV